ncbi:putative clathrin assembly protein At4g40080 [Tasmannia lanceolata]|uniref:putative clathrin assembly protein At4g40080 n=1 Tax=Tasmannia lanceolata TaxID=3420 RepID=UPI004062871C
MGRKSNIQHLLGFLKDKASVSKASLLSKTNSLSTSSPDLAVLRATTHEPSTPPNETHLTTLLSFGHSSRITASSLVKSLMDRLHKTHNSSVALKCLIIVHTIITRGTFILQDQLSIYPSSGGRNYLNLSNFRDNSGPESWYLSSWVRWYARFLEQLLFTSRILGFFLSNSAPFCLQEKVSSLTNKDLLKEVEALVGCVEEIGRAPQVGENRVVGEVVRLVAEDGVATQMEILVRVKEMRERLGCLSFGESIELVCVLRRLESCKERLLLFSLDEKTKEGGKEDLLGLVMEIKERVGIVTKEDGRRVARSRRESESDRLGDRVVRSDNSVRFSSGRFGGAVMSLVS